MQRGVAVAILVAAVMAAEMVSDGMAADNITVEAFNFTGHNGGSIYTSYSDKGPTVFILSQGANLSLGASSNSSK